MFSATFVTVALGLLAAATPVVKRDAATVVADLGTVSSDTTTLDNAVLAFSNTAGSLGDALAIHGDVTTLESAITKTTSDVKASGTFDEADGKAVLAAIQSLEPLILKTLSDTVAKEPGFNRIASDFIVESDLQGLQTDTEALESALLAAAPTDLLPSATPIVNAINAAFTSAVAAFAP